jgi:hypothetical protein
MANRIHRAFKRLHEIALDSDKEAGQSVILVISDRAFHYILNNNIKIRNDGGRLTTSVIQPIKLAHRRILVVAVLLVSLLDGSA